MKTTLAALILCLVVLMASAFPFERKGASPSSAAAKEKHVQYAARDDVNILAHGLLQLGQNLKEHVDKTKGQMRDIFTKLKAFNRTTAELGKESQRQQVEGESLRARARDLEDREGQLLNVTAELREKVEEMQQERRTMTERMSRLEERVDGMLQGPSSRNSSDARSIQLMLDSQNRRIDDLVERIRLQQEKLDKQNVRIRTLQSQIQQPGLRPSPRGSSGSGSTEGSAHSDAEEQRDSPLAKNVKKARRGETNYYPQPSGDSPENLEKERASLLTEIKIRNNERTIREKMARTFQFRRQEIVDQKPTIENLMERWPALFQMEEVDAEFLRVTAVPLLTRFMAHLDKHSPQLLKIFRKKGGITKAKTATILQFLDQGADADFRRECILKALIIYLGERVEDLIKEYMVSQKDQAEQELERTTMAVFVFRENSSLLQQPQDVGIVIDGVEVLNELPSLAAGVAMLFGLCYALNMEYPQGFRFTFEALQKILMELGSNKMTSKIHKLSGELKTAE